MCSFLFLLGNVFINFCIIGNGRRYKKNTKVCKNPLQ